MEFGFAEPTRGALATPSVLSTIARRGEEFGFGFIAISDHVVIPRNIESRYPYSETGEFAAAAAGECLDQLTMLSFLAGQTTSLKLVTSVMVLPHRSPVLTAKMLATIDVLSEGRLIVGCGVGWMREEFEALGAPSYDERGAVGDEYIRIFKELWTSDKSGIRWQIRPLLRHHVRPEAGAKAPSAHMDRRREPTRDAASGQARRRLVPHREQSKASVAHGGTAHGSPCATPYVRRGRRNAIRPRST